MERWDWDGTGRGVGDKRRKRREKGENIKEDHREPIQLLSCCGGAAREADRLAQKHGGGTGEKARPGPEIRRSNTVDATTLGSDVLSGKARYTFRDLSPSVAVHVIKRVAPLHPVDQGLAQPELLSAGTNLAGLGQELGSGPMEFVIENYPGGLPNLRYYPYTWTKTASIIFLDAPVGTGFSYSTTQEGWATSDSKSAEQSYQFIKKWFKENPQYLGVQFFVGGSSYSGITVPLITLNVIKGNENGDKPKLNLKGYLIGSPYTDSVIDENSKVVFAHRMALISDEMYENAKTACNETYTNVDHANTACVLALRAINKCLNDIETASILEPHCTSLSLEPNEHKPLRRFVEEDSFQISPLAIPKLWCHEFNFTLSIIWFNYDIVQEALHVRKGMVSSWTRCNWTLSFTRDIPTVVPIHQQLKKMELVVLVSTGDRDLIVPYTGTVNWIKSLNITVEDSWRPWFIHGQVAGYTVKYAEDEYYLTYSTVKGAGHPALEYHRKECFFMFDRWIHYYPL